MSEVRQFEVRRVGRREIAAFVETWHYSGSINGCIADYCYGLYRSAELIGGMFFGRMAMANQWRRFSDKPDDVIELRRLCCVDDTPRNTESYFIGKALRLLRADWGGRLVVSYADKEYGHAGTIYRASNFKELAPVKGARVIWYGGKRYHDKCIRTKYKGELKPFAAKIKAALDSGEAWYVNTAGKHTYVYELPVTKQQRGKL